MKKYLTILVLSFFLITPSQADDIRDFQIEGMSIGDSLLDYFSKELIEEDKRRDTPYKNNDFFIAEFGSEHFNSETFENARFHLKSDDEAYKIFHVAGELFYMNSDFAACLEKKNEITEELTKIFGTDKKQEGRLKKHVYDKTGDSRTLSTYFNLSDGRIRIMCTDWSEILTNENNWYDSLSLNIYSNEFLTWLNNKAYK